MPPNYLHHHPDFSDLIRIVGQEQSLDPVLVEKDYWVMHCLYGLQQMGLTFELKGGTSLSKGFGIINRFSEDIDLRIDPPVQRKVKTGHNQNKPAHCESRKTFYAWLAETIIIDGIVRVSRDESFDDDKYRSGGIRLMYNNEVGFLTGLKDGILLEVGFDDVIPNIAKDISSWAYDYAVEKVEVNDNRAKSVPCYHPGYTLVEKLQTLSTKYRTQQESGAFPINFIRHYYDVYCLLDVPEVQAFVSTPEYQAHKDKRFRSGDNPLITENEAFLLRNPSIRKEYEEAFQNMKTLYYKTPPSFDQIMDKIREHADRL
ncbi:nucleotidyl transferase AbiEii/AbiGii toxin family protein [Nitrospira sp. M1]